MNERRLDSLATKFNGSGVGSGVFLSNKVKANRDVSFRFGARDDVKAFKAKATKVKGVVRIKTYIQTEV